jgi:hypothetical protein
MKMSKLLKIKRVRMNEMEFEIVSQLVAQVNLTLGSFLPLPTKCREYQQAPPYPAEYKRHYNEEFITQKTVRPDMFRFPGHW